MTVKELYEWAEKHNCLDLELYKNVQLDMYPVQECYLFSFDLADKCEIQPRVVVD